MHCIPDRRIDSNPPEAWNMSKIEMEELDTNEDGIMEKFPIYVQNKAQRIPRPRDPQLVDPQPGCFGNGPGPMKVLLVLLSYGSVSAGRENWPFNVLFFLKVEPP